MFGVFAVWEQFCGAGSVLGAGSIHLFVLQGQCELCKCCSPDWGEDQGHRLHPGWVGRGPNVLLCVFSRWKLPTENPNVLLCAYSKWKLPIETPPGGINLVYFTLFLFSFSIKLENQLKMIVFLFPGVVSWRNGEEMWVSLKMRHFQLALCVSPSFPLGIMGDLNSQFIFLKEAPQVTSLLFL